MLYIQERVGEYSTDVYNITNLVVHMYYPLHWPGWRGWGDVCVSPSSSSLQHLLGPVHQLSRWRVRCTLTHGQYTDTLCNFVVSWVLWSIRIVYCMQYFVWTQLVACSGHAIHVYVLRVCLLHATCCVGPSHWSCIRLLSHNLACSAYCMLPLLHFSINVHTGIDLC